jgi:RNA polymerase sigma-70 factor (ECF subfamily)
MPLPDHFAAPAGAAEFALTRWSLIFAAQGAQAPAARQALADLCVLYWYPLYAFIRRQGFDVDRAQDLTQEFFARFWEKPALEGVAPHKGRFRSYLLTVCKHFLANERDRERAQKRGSGRCPVALDYHQAEARYLGEPGHHLTAEKLFDRRWTLALLDRVLDRLGAEYVRAGKAALFERLKPLLTAEENAGSHRQIAQELAMNEGAVRVAVHRLRGRYRELLREEIARTLDDPRQIDDEIRDLFAALRP